MTIEQRIDAFSELGSAIGQANDGIITPLTKRLAEAIWKCEQQNPWFTPVNVRRALAAHAALLTKENITGWLNRYDAGAFEKTPSAVAVIMAGNIPVVGFHDFLCVLITGNRLLAKTSSKDDILIRELSSMLTAIEPRFKEMITFSDGRIEKFDKIIATGSDNTARYFEYYFRNYPRLIRRNRTGVAVLEGNETDIQLEKLGDDVFSYFGLGCRNVTKIYMPEGFPVKRLGAAWEANSAVTENRKYISNYNYQKAVLEVNGESFTDTGFILIRKEKSLFPPVAVVHFEEMDRDSAETELRLLEDKIQVITGTRYTPFGFAQRPNLWDYSDGTDTIGFLSK